VKEEILENIRFRDFATSLGEEEVVIARTHVAISDQNGTLTRRNRGMDAISRHLILPNNMFLVAVMEHAASLDSEFVV
jgi:hypothetical protein